MSWIDLLTVPSSSTYQLLEIPAELVPLFEPSSKSRKLTIKGRHQDQAVVTTDTKTYALRSVSQSNSLLVCSINSEGLALQTNVTDTLELVPIVPRLERLGGLLRSSRYSGEEERPSQMTTKKYTLKQVQSIVQASPAELEQGLLKYRILQLDGVMRQISPDHIKSILQALLAQMDLNAYLPNSVPLQETVVALQRDHDLRPEVVTAVLTQFFGKEKHGVVELNAEEIVRFFGVQELLKARDAIPLNTFMDSWTTQVGDSLRSTLSLSLLQGEHILLPPNSSFIKRYSRSELPTEAAPRFQELFLTRPTWTATDLDPFISDLAMDTKRKDALLLKFARSSRSNDNVLLYSSRVKY